MLAIADDVYEFIAWLYIHRIRWGAVVSITKGKRDRATSRVVAIFRLRFAPLFSFFVFSFNIGKVHVTLVDMVTIFLDKLDLCQGFSAEITTQKETVFWNVRLPRSILASTVGEALSMDGAVMQTLYRNPLASPDVIGVTQAANLGAGLAIFFFAGATLFVQGFSFCCGVFALLLTFAIVSRLPGSSVTVLVLVGVIISALFQAGLTLLLYMFDPYSEMPDVNYWLMGALISQTGRTWLFYRWSLWGFFFLYCSAGG